MNPLCVDRRELFPMAAGGALALLAPNAPAQVPAGGPGLPVAPIELGPIHGQTLDRISSVLGSEPIDSKRALFSVIALLVELKIVTPEEGTMLKELVETIFDVPSLDDMYGALERMVSQWIERKAGDVALAVASIARDSVKYARGLVQGSEGIDRITAIYIVASDVRGALGGAAACARFGPALAALGALAGAVAASSRAVVGSRR